MFTSKLKSAAIAALIAIGGLGVAASTPTAAQAGDLRIGFEFGGPGYHIGFGDRYDRRHRDYRPRYRRTCKPRRALRKARRYGVRRAHIVRVNRRGGIVVAGRKYGDRFVMKFGRHRSCPVRFAHYR